MSVANCLELAVQRMIRAQTRKCPDKAEVRFYENQTNVYGPLRDRLRELGDSDFIDFESMEIGNIELGTPLSDLYVPSSPSDAVSDEYYRYAEDPASEPGYTGHAHNWHNNAEGKQFCVFCVKLATEPHGRYDCRAEGEEIN